MKIKIFLSLVLLATFSTLDLKAQTGGRDFTAVDNYVKSLGDLAGMSMGTINNVVSNKFTDKMDKARAIYYWVANNITYDVKSARNNSMMKNSPTEVLQSRKAVGIGFASLFQDMCSSADIRCLTVDGFVKNNAAEIGEKGEINHSWAVVQLGQSPEEWYYVDPAWGSGYASADMKEFTPQYTDAYFFSDKANFNLQHFPDNEAWKLGQAPRNKKDFYDLPLVRVAALEMRMNSFSPKNGKVTGKVDKPTYFSYTFSSNTAIEKVELGMGERKKYIVKGVQFSYAGGKLSFSYKFDDEDTYPLTILINGKELMTYLVTVD